MEKEISHCPEVAVERQNNRKVIALWCPSRLPTKKTTVNPHCEGTCLCVWAQVRIAFESIAVASIYRFLCLCLTRPVFMGISYIPIFINCPFRARCEPRQLFNHAQRVLEIERNYASLNVNATHSSPIESRLYADMFVYQFSTIHLP